MMPTHQLHVVETAINEIERHPENANNGDTDALEESISVNGFYSPVIVQSETGYILAGNHRWEVAVRMGATTIPAIFLDVDNVEARRIMLADNRITRMGHDDPAMLADLLQELQATDAGLAGTGFTDHDLVALLGELDKPLKMNDPEPDLGEKWSKFEVYPIDSEDGSCTEFLVTRVDEGKFWPSDFNEVRDLLGLPALAQNEIDEVNYVPDWRK